jgi:hypothetical protein
VRKIKIFISYRHAETTFSISRIYDYLQTHLKNAQVFRDIASIPPGADFPSLITRHLQECDLVLIVISAQWTGIDPVTGKRRIDDPTDTVRLEVEAALNRNIPVIPLLIQDTEIPGSGTLPPSLARLTNLQAVQIHDDPYFDVDMSRLVKGIEGILFIDRTPSFFASIPVRIIGSVILVAAIIFASLYFFKLNPFGGATASGTTWHRVTSPSPGTALDALQDVAAVDANNVWAVGNSTNDNVNSQTLVEHWDGSFWSVVSSPNPGTNSNGLSSIAVVSANNIWAVGSYYNSGVLYRTLIEHWDGSKWSVVPSANPSHSGEGLDGIAALAPNNIWAVGFVSTSTLGNQTLIEHWDGTSWTAEPSPNTALNTNRLFAITAIAPNNIWAVGSAVNVVGGAQTASQTLIEHWDGTSWKIATTPSSGYTFNRLFSATALSATDIWAAGYVSNDNVHFKTLVYHWDGVNWQIIPSPNPQSTINRLTGITAYARNNVWAVGYTSDNNISTQALIEHWNGSSWTVAPTVKASTLLGATAVNASDVWAVGTVQSSHNTSTQDLILHGP